VDVTPNHREAHSKGKNELSVLRYFLSIKRHHIISIAFIINFGILPPFTIYDSGSHSHAASGKIFFPIASTDEQVLNPDKNGRMTSHTSQIKCFINLPPKS